MGTMEAAASIYTLTNNMIYDLIHKSTVQRGLDPRRYGLLSFGGTAGMHAGIWGEMLGVEKTIIPNTASVQGAFGLVSSDVVHEYQISESFRVPVELKEVNGIFDKLEKQATSLLETEGFQKESIGISRSVDMLYGRQVHVITTPIDKVGKLANEDMETVYNRFEQLYEEKYGQGSAYREAGMIVSCFRLRATGFLKKPIPYKYEISNANPEKALIDTKGVYFDTKDGMVETNIFDFQKLEPGNEVKGPAIILTPITTIVVFPHHRAYCDEFKNIILYYKQSNLG
jgi:N-methylhydantoinase A